MNEVYVITPGLKIPVEKLIRNHKVSDCKKIDDLLEFIEFYSDKLRESNKYKVAVNDIKCRDGKGYLKLIPQGEMEINFSKQWPAKEMSIMLDILLRRMKRVRFSYYPPSPRTPSLTRCYFVTKIYEISHEGESYSMKVWYSPNVHSHEEIKRELEDYFCESLDLCKVSARKEVYEVSGRLRYENLLNSIQKLVRRGGYLTICFDSGEAYISEWKERADITGRIWKEGAEIHS